MNEQTDITPYLYHSAEIRWFLPPTTDWETALDWFIGNESKKADQTQDFPAEKTLYINHIKREELRTDEYLVIPQCTTVGVKQRQGKLEIKAQIGISEKYLNGLISGDINYWSKWSHQPSEANKDFLKKDLHLSGEWLKINKIRYLLKFSHSENMIQEVSPEEWPEKGCQVELTQVWAEGFAQKWTSFGLEAFGDTFQNMGISLKDAILFFLSKRNEPPMLLSSKNSMCYPVWLQLFQIK